MALQQITFGLYPKSIAFSMPSITRFHPERKEMRHSAYSDTQPLQTDGDEATGG